jgi:hypothetical protein
LSAPARSAWGAGLNNAVFAIVLSGSDVYVYVGGFFSDAGGNTAADRIARWNGSTWNFFVRWVYIALVLRLLARKCLNIKQIYPFVRANEWQMVAK